MDSKYFSTYDLTLPSTWTNISRVSFQSRSSMSAPSSDNTRSLSSSTLQFEVYLPCTSPCLPAKAPHIIVRLPVSVVRASHHSQKYMISFVKMFVSLVNSVRQKPGLTDVTVSEPAGGIGNRDAKERVKNIDRSLTTGYRAIGDCFEAFQYCSSFSFARILGDFASGREDTKKCASLDTITILGVGGEAGDSMR